MEQLQISNNLTLYAVSKALFHDEKSIINRPAWNAKPKTAPEAVLELTNWNDFYEPPSALELKQQQSHLRELAVKREKARAKRKQLEALKKSTLKPFLPDDGHDEDQHSSGSDIDQSSLGSSSVFSNFKKTEKLKSPNRTPSSRKNNSDEASYIPRPNKSALHRLTRSRALKSAANGNNIDFDVWSPIGMHSSRKDASTSYANTETPIQKPQTAPSSSSIPEKKNRRASLVVVEEKPLQVVDLERAFYISSHWAQYDDDDLARSMRRRDLITELTGCIHYISPSEEEKNASGKDSPSKSDGKDKTNSLGSALKSSKFKPTASTMGMVGRKEMSSFSPRRISMVGYHPNPNLPKYGISAKPFSPGRRTSNASGSGASSVRNSNTNRPVLAKIQSGIELVSSRRQSVASTGRKSIDGNSNGRKSIDASAAAAALAALSAKRKSIDANAAEKPEADINEKYAALKTELKADTNSNNNLNPGGNNGSSNQAGKRGITDPNSKPGNEMTPSEVRNWMESFCHENKLPLHPELLRPSRQDFMPEIETARKKKKALGVMAMAALVARKRLAIRKRRKLKSKGIETQLDGVYDHNIVLSILKREPHERTKAECEKLFKCVKNLKAFSKLSSFVLHQLCSVFLYTQIERDRAVFLQGETGTSWYVILKGKVDVKISKTGNLEDSKSVVQMESGAGFGDLALVNDKPRSATVVTMTDCDFARVEKADYNRILRFIHDTECKEKAVFMKKLKHFESWNVDSLKSVVDVIKWKKFPAKTYITEEGKPLKEIYIVRHGTVQLQQNLQIDDFKARVPIFNYGEGEFFGEAVMSSEEIVSPFSLYAQTEVELAVVNTLDALSNLKVHEMILSMHGETNQTKILQKFRDHVRDKKWETFKQGYLRHLAKEKFNLAPIRNLPPVEEYSLFRINKKKPAVVSTTGAPAPVNPTPAATAPATTGAAPSTATPATAPPQTAPTPQTATPQQATPQQATPQQATPPTTNPITTNTTTTSSKLSANSLNKTASSSAPPTKKTNFKNELTLDVTDKKSLSHSANPTRPKQPSAMPKGVRSKTADRPKSPVSVFKRLSSGQSVSAKSLTFDESAVTSIATSARTLRSSSSRVMQRDSSSTFGLSSRVTMASSKLFQFPRPVLSPTSKSILERKKINLADKKTTTSRFKALFS